MTAWGGRSFGWGWPIRCAVRSRTRAVPDAVPLEAPTCDVRVPGAIPAESAGDHLDTFQAVEFEVVQAKDTGRVTFLNSVDRPCQAPMWDGGRVREKEG